MHYTREYEVAGTLHATSTLDADVLHVLPATSCFQESFFGVLSSALKSGGNVVEEEAGTKLEQLRETYPNAVLSVISNPQTKIRRLDYALEQGEEYNLEMPEVLSTGVYLPHPV